MGKYWFAGPKKGRANFFSMVAVSWKGHLATFLVIALSSIGSIRIVDRFDGGGWLLGLVILLASYSMIFISLRLIVYFAVRDRVDYEHTYKDYEDGVLIRKREGVQ